MTATWGSGVAVQYYCNNNSYRISDISLVEYSKQEEEREAEEKNLKMMKLNLERQTPNQAGLSDSGDSSRGI